jgi:hypothetical protein
MPILRKFKIYVYVNKGKKTDHIIIPIEDRIVDEKTFKNWRDINEPVQILQKL